jgi:hypothetical protein
MDFNQQVADLRGLVSLTTGPHELSVRLASTPGSFIEVSVRGLPAPGIPLTAVRSSAGTAFVPESGQGTLTFQVTDVTGAPLSGVNVRLDVQEFAHQSGGIFFADTARTRFSYSAPAAPTGATATTDVTGNAQLVVDPRGLGRYRLGATLPDAPWVPRYAFYIEATPNPGSWFDRTSGLATSPSARGNPNMMFDTRRHRVLLFGGADASTAFSDLWELPVPADPVAPPTTWRQITPLGPSLPPPVPGTTAIYDPIRDRVVVMTSDSSFGLAIWAFTFGGAAGTDGSWSQVPFSVGPATTLPVGLQSHLYGAAVYDPIRDRMLQFAGFTTTTTRSDTTSDLLILDLATAVVTGVRSVDAASPTLAPVPPRTLTGAIFDVVDSRMIIYGGLSNTDLGDAWQADFRLSPLGEWTQLAQESDAPGHDMLTDLRNYSIANDSPRERAVVYGGMIGPPTTPRPSMGKVWEMRYDTPGRIIWNLLQPLITPGPRDAQGAGSVFDIDTGRMFVFGGIRPESGPPGELFFDDTWEMNWDFRPPFDGQIVVEFNHWAVFDDGADSATLEVTKDAAAVPTGVTVTGATARLSSTFPRAGLVVPGSSGPVPLDVTGVALSDDGTRGDDVAGDGVFHLGPVTYAGSLDSPQLPTLLNVDVDITLSDGTSLNVGTVLHAVPTGTVVPTSPVAGPVPPQFTVSRSANVMFVTDPFRILSPSYRSGSLDIAPVTSFAYLFLQDRYHWATVMPTRLIRAQTTMEVEAPRGGPVRRPAAHIGLDAIRDSSAIYCCAAPAVGPACSLCTELLGFSYVNTPLPRVLEHEWVHTYGDYFDVDRTMAGAVSILDNPARAHWSFATNIHSLMSAGGAAGSLLFPGIPSGGNPNSFCYAPVSTLDMYDLYVMGVVPSTALPDVTVMVDPVIDPSSCGGSYTTSMTYTGAQLIAANGGPRSFPGVTSYAAAVIAVTPDTAFTDAERAYFELYASFMSSGPAAGVMSHTELQLPFAAAAQGHATVDTSISVH